jgi:oligopeptide transport system ATP-binding protein
MSTPVDEVLRVENLVKTFPVRRGSGVVHAVSDVSFSIGRGETVGLVGESGSGKTTVGRCILRLVEPSSGTIRFGGQDITQMSQKQFRARRARIQMVFQEPYDSLNPRMRIASILEENLSLEGRLDETARRARVSELLEMIRLPARAAQAYPHELTSGEQQRVSVGRALATGPDLIVLDEPTSALDIGVRAEVIDLLADLQSRTGVSYLFISHDLTAVKQLSHRVIIMYLGEVVENAPTAELFAEQIHPYSMALLGSVLVPNPKARQQSIVLRREIPSPVNLPSGCYLHPRCPFAIADCETTRPQLEMARPGWSAACHRKDEITSGMVDLQTIGRASRSRLSGARRAEQTLAPTEPTADEE